MGKNYKYFIAFTHDRGNGNMQLLRSKPIENLDDINVIQGLIKKDAKEKDGIEVKNVCITNFQLF